VSESESLEKFLRKTPQLANKGKFLVAVTMFFMISLLSANLFSAPMHHMDDADCMMETTCHHCFISALTYSPDLKSSFLVVSLILETQNSFKHNQIAPPSPPPKN